MPLKGFSKHVVSKKVRKNLAKKNRDNTVLIVSTGMCSLEKKIDFAEGLSAAVLLVAGQGARSLSNLEGDFSF